MLRKTRSRKGSDLTESNSSSVVNGQIGQPYRRVRSLSFADNNAAAQKRERKNIYENTKSVRVSDVCKNSTIVSHDNKYSEYFTSSIEHREKSELQYLSVPETCEKSSCTLEGNYKRNGIVHSNFKNNEGTNINIPCMPSSNLKIELCLALYCLFSLIYLNILVSLEKKHFYFSSLEEALSYKIVWCLLFGAIVDLFTLKLAIQIQSLLWISLFISKFLDLNTLFSNSFAKACLSSSSSLVTEITFIKLYKREKCWLPICRLNIISSLCLFCGQIFYHDTFISSREVLWNLTKERLFNAVSLSFLNYFTKYMDVDLSSVMSIGCTLCLLTTAYLYSEQIEHSECPTLSDSDHFTLSRKLSTCILILLLKVTIFLPAFCFAIIFNSYMVKWTLVLMPIQFIALCCLLLIGQYLSVSWTLSVLSLLMYFCSLITMYFHRYLPNWLSISVLMFSAVVVMIKPSFQYLARQQLNESFLGISLSSLISLHFIMKYFSPMIIDGIKSSDIFQSFKLF